MRWNPVWSLWALTLAITSCTQPDGSGQASLQAVLDSLAAASEAEVGIVYRTLDGRDSAMVNPDLRMHAASTMKVPVMLQLVLDDEADLLDLDGTIPVETTFHSILDGSEYRLDVSSDSDSALYARVGEEVSRRELMDRMITRSSNLATNLLIRDVDARRVTRTLRNLGADSIEVLRGVEDIPAFEAGMSNTTTARDLALVMSAVVQDERVSPAGREEMLAILERQHFRENIPAGLPPGVRVANKTGWITGINHDAALVFPADGAPYVLVVLLRNHPAEDQGTGFAAEVSRVVWEHYTGVRDPQ